MKKKIKAGIIGLMLCSILCVPVLADEIKVDESSDAIEYSVNEAVSVNISYKGAVEGNEYLVLAFKEGKTDLSTLTDKDIVFINQEKADKDGVNFTVYPSKLENGATYIVRLYSNEGGFTAFQAIKFTFHGESTVTIPFGHVAKESSITAQDASFCLQIAAGLKVQLAGMDEPDYIVKGSTMYNVADVDANGTVEAADASFLLQVAAGLMYEKDLRANQNAG